MAAPKPDTATPATETAKPAPDWTTLTVAPTASLKPARDESDVPEQLRAIAEQSHTSGNVLAVTLPNADAVKDFLRYMRLYGQVRKAGRVTVRATVQKDGRTVHVKVTAYKPKQTVAAA